MAEHVYSKNAGLDLLEIWEFIARDDLEAAEGVIEGIEQAVSMRVTNPGLGHRRPDLTSQPVRLWPIYSYLLIYNPDAQPLEVVRILSGYRDFAAMLE